MSLKSFDEIAAGYAAELMARIDAIIQALPDGLHPKTVSFIRHVAAGELVQAFADGYMAGKYPEAHDEEYIEEQNQKSAEELSPSFTREPSPFYDEMAAALMPTNIH